MDFQSLESKKIGNNLALLRKNSKKSLEKIASSLGVEKETLQDYEKGDDIPSLPQLEILADVFNVSVHDILTGDLSIESAPALDEDKREQMIGLRNRIIALLIKQSRLEKGLSLEFVAENSGSDPETLKLYETGKIAIPVLVLEKLCTVLDIPLTSLFSKISDQAHTVVVRKEPLEKTEFDLPEELKTFISKPINRPYLELAKRISEMNAEKLRGIAEGLLEITY